MELAGHVFHEASAIDAMRNSDGWVRTYTYTDRTYANVYDLHSNPTGRRLHAHGRGPFIFVDLDPLPSTPAAYVIVRAEAILYVGISQNLDQRWGPLGYGVISLNNCYAGGQTTNCRINNLIAMELIAGRTLGLWANETPTPEPVEAAVYRSLKPLWNDAVPPSRCATCRTSRGSTTRGLPAIETHQCCLSTRTPLTSAMKQKVGTEWLNR